MVISRILNNNAIVTLNELNEEEIVFGKGIAFKKKIGDHVDESLVSKKFVMENQEIAGRFQQIINKIPMDYLSLTDDLIKNIKIKLGKKIGDNLYISLSDHIYSAVNRKREGIELKNTMLWDIKRFYPVEYQLGLESLAIIKKQLDVQLSVDEAGFIAFHIVNTELDEQENNLYDITRLMTEIMSIVKYHFNRDFDEDSIYFYRFATHLKFLAQRLFNGTLHQDREDSLFTTIKETYPASFACTIKIQEFIKRKYHHELSNEEVCYLTIHLDRLVYRS